MYLIIELKKINKKKKKTLDCNLSNSSLST